MKTFLKEHLSGSDLLFDTAKTDLQLIAARESLYFTCLFCDGGDSSLYAADLPCCFLQASQMGTGLLKGFDIHGLGGHMLSSHYLAWLMLLGSYQWLAAGHQL